MKEIILVKLGGSLITDKTKPYTAQPQVVKRLVKETKEFFVSHPGQLVLGHGGGSFPHVPAQKYQTAQGWLGRESGEGVVAVHEAAVDLNRLVIDVFRDQKIPALSLAPSAFLIGHSGRIEEGFVQVVRAALGRKLLPVVFGDVLLDQKQGCMIASTEMVFHFLATSLTGVRRVFLVGVTDGIYDDQKKRIPEITAKKVGRLEKWVSGSAGIDVTGGMTHKLKESLSLAGRGIETWIINGTRKGELLKALKGELVRGTVIR